MARSIAANIYEVICLSVLMTCASAAHAKLDADEIYKFASCAPYDPKLPQKDWKVPRRMSIDIDRDLINGQRQFPRWGASLGSYLALVENFNRGTDDASCRPFSIDHRAPHPLTQALAEVTKLTVDEIGRTIASQRRDLNRAMECTNRIKPEHLDRQQTFLAEHFAEAATQTLSGQQCALVTNFLLQDLKARYQRMRFNMAVMAGSSKHASRLEHDQPFSQFIAAVHFPAVMTRAQSVPGLAPDEVPAFLNFQTETAMKLRSEFEKSMGGVRPRTHAQLYDNLISTTPILLQMPDGVSARSLKNATANMMKQYDFDISELKNNPNQEIMLYTLYVEKAIGQIPEERRQVACHAVKQVFENLITQYEERPRQLAMFGYAMSIPTGGTGALGAVGFKALAGEFMKRSGIAASAFSATLSIQNFQRYQSAVEFCGAIVSEKFEDPTGAGLCTISKGNGILENAETAAAVSAIFGGAMWLKGPVLNSYQKTREFIRNGKAVGP